MIRADNEPVISLEVIKVLLMVTAGLFIICLIICFLLTRRFPANEFFGAVSDLCIIGDKSNEAANPLESVI